MHWCSPLVCLPRSLLFATREALEASASGLPYEAGRCRRRGQITREQGKRGLSLHTMRRLLCSNLVARWRYLYRFIRVLLSELLGHLRQAASMLGANEGFLFSAKANRSWKLSVVHADEPFLFAFQEANQYTNGRANGTRQRTNSRVREEQPTAARAQQTHGPCNLSSGKMSFALDRRVDGTLEPLPSPSFDSCGPAISRLPSLPRPMAGCGMDHLDFCRLTSGVERLRRRAFDPTTSHTLSRLDRTTPGLLLALLVPCLRENPKT